MHYSNLLNVLFYRIVFFNSEINLFLPIEYPYLTIIRVIFSYTKFGIPFNSFWIYSRLAIFALVSFRLRR